MNKDHGNFPPAKKEDFEKKGENVGCRMSSFFHIVFYHL